MNRINYVVGDLFDCIKTIKGTKVIPHVCNNKGAWGAGFVVPLGEHFPIAKEEYLSRFHNQEKPLSVIETRVKPLSLGDLQMVSVSESVVVANMVAQTLGGKRRPLHYNALSKCMNEIGGRLVSIPDWQNLVTIHAPVFGAGLAGGRWEFIADLIEDCWLRRDLSVTIYWLEKDGHPCRSKRY